MIRFWVWEIGFILVSWEIWGILKFQCSDSLSELVSSCRQSQIGCRLEIRKFPLMRICFATTGNQSTKIMSYCLLMLYMCIGEIVCLLFKCLIKISLLRNNNSTVIWFMSWFFVAGKAFVPYIYEAWGTSCSTKLFVILLMLHLCFGMWMQAILIISTKVYRLIFL